MSQLIVCIPDVHVPYHHPRALRALTKMIGDVQPDRVIQLGDFLDMLAPARWSRGLVQEYAAGVDHEARVGREALGDIRAVYKGPMEILDGNHEDRLHAYIRSHAPALAGIVPNTRELLKLDDLGIEQVKQPHKLAQGTLAIHGKALSSTQSSAGQSAFKERVRHGQSIVQGHTHRLGLGYDTADRTRFWMECGWLGNIRTAGSYLAFKGVANWQIGFGYLVLDGSHVTPHIVPMRPDGSFTFERREYRG